MVANHFLRYLPAFGKRWLVARLTAMAHFLYTIALMVGLTMLLPCAAAQAVPTTRALAWNRDPREIKTYHRAQSAGAQSALGKKPAEATVYRPTLWHLADRIGTRCAPSLSPAGR